jgi:hypothetical protein
VFWFCFQVLEILEYLDALRTSIEALWAQSRVCGSCTSNSSSRLRINSCFSGVSRLKKQALGASKSISRHCPEEAKGQTRSLLGHVRCNFKGDQGQMIKKGDEHSSDTLGQQRSFGFIIYFINESGSAPGGLELSVKTASKVIPGRRATLRVQSSVVHPLLRLNLPPDSPLSSLLTADPPRSTATTQHDLLSWAKSVIPFLSFRSCGPCVEVVSHASVVCRLLLSFCFCMGCRLSRTCHCCLLGTGLCLFYVLLCVSYPVLHIIISLFDEFPWPFFQKRAHCYFSIVIQLIGIIYLRASISNNYLTNLKILIFAKLVIGFYLTKLNITIQLNYVFKTNKRKSLCFIKVACKKCFSGSRWTDIRVLSCRDY